MTSLLADVQHRFRAAVLEGKDAELNELVSTAGSRAARIEIYRRSVRGSLVDALSTAFPMTRRIVGAEYFAVLANRFIAAAPPQRPQLSLFGGAFAGFIAGENTREVPYLADTARLEWARQEAYFAADAPMLDATALAAMPVSDLERIQLVLHPAARLIRSRYPIHRIWHVNQPTVELVPQVDMTVAQDVLVSRSEHGVVARVIIPGDAVFIEAILSGANLGDAAEAAVTHDIGFDLQSALAPHFLYGTFRRAG